MRMKIGGTGIFLEGLGADLHAVNSSVEVVAVGYTAHICIWKRMTIQGILKMILLAVSKMEFNLSRKPCRWLLMGTWLLLQGAGLLRDGEADLLKT